MNDQRFCPIKPGQRLTHKVKKPQRNDPCPCGSGRKFKKCHLGVEKRKERK